MEWYNVLRSQPEQEESNTLLSFESWMQLGINVPQCFWSDAKPIGEFKFMTKSLTDEVDTDMFTHERDQSSSSSVCGASLQTFGNGWPDHQLDELEEIDEMDDIFLSSILEDLPIKEESRGSPCFKTSAADQLTDTIFYSQSNVGQNSHGTSNLKHHETQALSPSNDWENYEQSKEGGDMHDESVAEENILQHLGTIMDQMTEKTRLCFRDALYRLANNSRQESLGLDKSHESDVHDGTFRLGRTDMSESETNTIDRAVTDLMFNKMQLNAQELPEISVKIEHGTIPNKGEFDYMLNLPEMPYLPESGIFSGDAEVPVFCDEN